MNEIGPAPPRQVPCDRVLRRTGTVPSKLTLGRPCDTAAPQRAALGFILVTVGLDMLAMAIVIPVLPKLVLAFLNGDTARAAGWFGLFGTIWAFMQFICAPVQGALSDRFGRRPIILLSNFGLALSYLLLALAPNLYVLLVSRLISGATAASMSVGGAYIADVMPPGRRSIGFGKINVAIGIGLVLGPAMGGMLGAHDPRLPFWVAAGLSLLNTAYGFVVLPESLPGGARSRFEWRRANPVGALTLLWRDTVLRRLGTISFLGSLAQQALPAVFVLYAGYRYGWDERAVGLALAGLGICFALVGGGLIRPIVRYAGESCTLLLGLAAGALGFAIFALAPTGRALAAGIPVMALWSLATAATQALMSRRVAPCDQGLLQGAGSSVVGIAGLLGPALFTGIFAFAIAGRHSVSLPGAPFLAAMLLLLVAAVVALHMTTSCLTATAVSEGWKAEKLRQDGACTSRS